MPISSRQETCPATPSGSSTSFPSYRLTSHLFNEGIDLAHVTRPSGGYCSFDLMDGIACTNANATAWDATTT
ncbi:MAG: hypothetical protein ACRD0P_21165, partial [Stackebrandtia sp.]